MATEQIKNQILIELFKLNREKLNSLFSFYKFTYPVIEKEVVFFYISFIIEPVIEKNSIRDKEVLSAFLLSLYEKILELIGKNFLGNSGRYPFFEGKFIQCLEDSSEFLFENPDLYLSSISNAIVNLGTADLSKLDTWLSKFQKLNKKAKTIQELFDAGKITAWACGMAQFRQKALEICKHLETELLEIALGISNIRSINRDNFITRLESDPWMSPETAMKENSPRKNFQLKRVGSFIGFGGEFLTPPKVEILDNEFIVYDAKNFYVLFSDIFGSHLQRISEDTYLTLASEKTKPSATNFIFTKDGIVKHKTDELEYKPLANYSSYAANSTTLCITSPYSHNLFVVGLG